MPLFDSPIFSGVRLGHNASWPTAMFVSAEMSKLSICLINYCLLVDTSWTRVSVPMPNDSTSHNPAGGNVTTWLEVAVLYTWLVYVCGCGDGWDCFYFQKHINSAILLFAALTRQSDWKFFPVLVCPEYVFCTAVDGIHLRYNFFVNVLYQ